MGHPKQGTIYSRSQDVCVLTDTLDNSADRPKCMICATRASKLQICALAGMGDAPTKLPVAAGIQSKDDHFPAETPTGNSTDPIRPVARSRTTSLTRVALAGVSNFAVSEITPFFWALS